MPRPIVKNTCTWITSDDSPAGIPSFMPRNSSPNWNTPIAKPVRDDDARRHARAAE